MYVFSYLQYLESFNKMQDQLETFRLNCPLDNKYLKQVVELGSSEVLSLELYCPPILLDSHLKVVRTYIKTLNLNLKARKVNQETIEIIEEK